jgi:hypothetical protein
MAVCGSPDVDNYREISYLSPMLCKKSKLLRGLIAISSLTISLCVTSINADSSFADLESSRGYPVRGASTSAVLEKYGEPEMRNEPVGVPPISVWKYPEFSVYFESELVITSVAEKDHLPRELKQIQ